MKRTIRILNVLTIIICVLTIVVLFISICGLNNVNGESVTAKRRALIALILLVPILVCHMANTKLENTYIRKDIIFIAILTLILGNVISGILMLRMKDFD